MGIKTVHQPPYWTDHAACDFWLFPKLRGCRYETIEEMKEAVTKVLTRSHKRTSMGLREVEETVLQVHCSGRRLLRSGLEFHVCTINKSAHTKKSGNLSFAPRIYKCFLFKETESSGTLRYKRVAKSRPKDQTWF